MCMSSPSNSHPSHAAIPERHCWAEILTGRLASASEGTVLSCTGVIETGVFTEVLLADCGDRGQRFFAP